MATTEYRPNRHGAARSTVRRHHPRVVSRPNPDRHSCIVVSMFHRAVYRLMTTAGTRAGSVVNRYSSRWVPVRSATNTHRTGTSPRPDLYQCPVLVTTATRRVPPPYHPTVSRDRDRGLSP